IAPGVFETDLNREILTAAPTSSSVRPKRRIGVRIRNSCPRGGVPGVGRVELRDRTTDRRGRRFARQRGESVNAVLVISGRDNVATALEPLDKGRTITVRDETVLVAEPIARGHKISLRAIRAGDA